MPRVSYKLLGVHILYDSKHIGTINPLYLRDVIKTVPQTLSDTDKNQALANLGIDPIVWKYICNPLVIRDEMECPQELLNNGNLKYKIPAMYVVLFMDNDLNHIYRAPTSYVDDNLVATFTVDGSIFYQAVLRNGKFTVEEVV